MKYLYTSLEDKTGFQLTVQDKLNFNHFNPQKHQTRRSTAPAASLQVAQVATSRPHRPTGTTKLSRGTPTGPASTPRPLSTGTRSTTRRNQFKKSRSRTSRCRPRRRTTFPTACSARLSVWTRCRLPRRRSTPSKTFADRNSACRRLRRSTPWKPKRDACWTSSVNSQPSKWNRPREPASETATAPRTRAARSRDSPLWTASTPTLPKHPPSTPIKAFTDSKTSRTAPASSSCRTRNLATVAPLYRRK